MANHARLLLETALRAKRLDQTLTSTIAPLAGSEAAPSATGIDALDRLLRGGLPQGQLSEVTGPPSSGRTTLALQVVASATARGEIAAYIDTFDRLDVASAAAAGVALDRLLWVRGQAISRTDAGTALRERTLERALKSLMLVLQAGGFGVVVIDLADVPMAALRQLPPATWLRVQRAVEGHETACVLLAPEPLARSAGGLTLALTAHPEWRGASARSRVMSGVQVDARVISPRRRTTDTFSVSAQHAWAAMPPAVCVGGQ